MQQPTNAMLHARNMLHIVSHVQCVMSCRAREKGSNDIYALKKIKLPPSWHTEGFPMTSVREINLLLALSHPNIVAVKEVVAQRKDVYMVMEFVQQDLKLFLEQYKSRLKIGEVCSALASQLAPQTGMSACTYCITPQTADCRHACHDAICTCCTSF